MVKISSLWTKPILDITIVCGPPEGHSHMHGDKLKEKKYVYKISPQGGDTKERD